MITLLNSPILTAYGKFDYREITLDAARRLVTAQVWQSAIGHASTAQVISDLLVINCQQNRVPYHQSVGDTALIFAPSTRLPEGAILSSAELNRIECSWGVLQRVA